MILVIYRGTTTGILRGAAFASYSANAGIRRFCRSQITSRSAGCGDPRRDLTVSVPTSTVVSGCARGYRTRPGWSGAPALDAKTASRPQSAGNASGLTRSVPLRAPVWCSRSMSAPSNGPPDLAAVGTELSDDLAVEVSDLRRTELCHDAQFRNGT